MHRHTASLGFRLITLVTGLALLTPGVARADTSYKIQVLFKAGDQVGDVPTRAPGFAVVSKLNDNGQFLLGTDPASGDGALLAQFADGKFTPILAPGQSAPTPDGQWPKGIGFWGPVSMNEQGDVAFSAAIGPKADAYGVYLWDRASQQVKAIANKDTPAVNDLTFQWAGDTGTSVNNRGEMTFSGCLKGARSPYYFGLFLHTPDGQLQAVVLPDQPLPGRGRKLVQAYDAHLTDEGLISFSALGTPGPPSDVYVWEKDAIRVVAEKGMEVPGIGKISATGNFGGNNKNRKILVGLRLVGNKGNGLYLWSDGNFTPVAVVGQEMPGGGQLKKDEFQWGLPSEAGEYAFVAQVVEGGATRGAAYRMDSDGKLSLVLKTGAATDLGTVTGIGGEGLYGVALNSQGQVLLPVKIDNGPSALILLTPTAQ
jgi:hypothetical protein